MACGVYETMPNRHALEDAVWCETGHPYGLTYQSCRYCHAGWPEEMGLWKYGVRHYICDACRNQKLGILADDRRVRRSVNDHSHTPSRNPDR